MILGVVVLTVAASLLSPAGKAQTAISNARRHATSYLDSERTADPVERQPILRLLLAERDQIVAIGLKYRRRTTSPGVRLPFLNWKLSKADLTD